MNKFFYLKLAIQNLKKNSKMIIPYLLTSTLFVMMFYVIMALSTHSEFYGRTRGVLLALGVIVIAIFAIIFLFYTNSFIIKQRKSELGLYNILGMEKRHISRILIYESTILLVISLVGGILIGSLFGQAIFLLLIKMIGDLPTMRFEISVASIQWTMILFIGIFTLTTLFNVSQIHLSKPIDLLKSKSAGEQEPKVKWIMALLGLLCLGVGYYLAVIVQNPVDAIALFFLAVILVIFGTYFLFTAGSIALLKLMRKNKKYYYKTSHFVSVSNMIYRMKQNAVGLGNICILSTMVLVMISSTGSLFLGVNDLIDRQVSKDVELSFGSDSSVMNQQVDEAMMKYLKDLDTQDFSRNYSFTLTMKRNEDTFEVIDGNNYPEYYYVYFSTNDELSLKEDEIAVYFDDGTTLENLTIGSKTYHVVLNSDQLNNGALERMFSYNPGFKGLVYVAMKDENAIDELTSNIDLGQYTYLNFPQYNYAFNCDFNEKEYDEVYENVNNIYKTVSSQSENMGNGYSTLINFKYEVRQEIMELFGSFFFLGIFLSVLFMIATTLIMYYKQISEGYDDVKRYEILQKVGMSHEEVKSSIHSQIMIIFFMPLITAGIHLMFSFNMIYQMFSAFGMNSKAMFASVMGVVFVIFSLFYFVTYQLTAKVYYKIVS